MSVNMETSSRDIATVRRRDRIHQSRNSQQDGRLQRCTRCEFTTSKLGAMGHHTKAVHPRMQRECGIRGCKEEVTKENLDDHVENHKNGIIHNINLDIEAAPEDVPFQVKKTWQNTKWRGLITKCSATKVSDLRKMIKERILQLYALTGEQICLVSVTPCPRSPYMWKFSTPGCATTVLSGNAARALSNDLYNKMKVDGADTREELSDSGDRVGGVSGERVDGENVSGDRADGESVSGDRADGESVSGDRADGESVSGDRADGESVSEERVDGVSEEIVDGVSEERVDCVSEERVDGVSEERVDGVSEERVDGKNVSGERVDGVSEEIVDGVSEERVDGVSEERVDGVSEERVDGENVSGERDDGVSGDRADVVSAEIVDDVTAVIVSSECVSGELVGVSVEIVDSVSEETDDTKGGEKGGGVSEETDDAMSGKKDGGVSRERVDVVSRERLSNESVSKERVGCAGVTAVIVSSECVSEKRVVCEGMNEEKVIGEIVNEERVATINDISEGCTIKREYNMSDGGTEWFRGVVRSVSTKRKYFKILWEDETEEETLNKKQMTFCLKNRNIVIR
ncbi:unnamed protein product [Owenia fusiformis]|uniref:Uncharacterized protein n=1 Tax=Owenia fusiformis TaxID=6347 RepID=A0A8S4NEG1_OWEFU|nr:unnamed protein product [Owenia fusiformis]